MIIVGVQSPSFGNYEHVGAIDRDAVCSLKVSVIDYRLEIMIEHLFENKKVFVAPSILYAKLAVHAKVDHICLDEIYHYILQRGNTCVLINVKELDVCVLNDLKLVDFGMSGDKSTRVNGEIFDPHMLFILLNKLFFEKQNLLS